MYGMGYGWGGLYGMGMYGMGMGMWGKRDTTETKPVDVMPSMNKTECVYYKNSSTITCIGLAELVECKTELIWNAEEIKREFLMYGIAKSETTPRSYKLLPRTITNSAWLENTYLVNGVKKEVSLFNSESLDHLGLRVIDETCFNRLDDLFKISKRNEKVFVQTKDSIEMPIAIIVGDLVVTDMTKETSKRHYGYGGYRGGYGGYRGGYGGYRGGYGGYHGGYGGYGRYRGGWRG